jgi:Na+/phosphate symporter
VLIRYIKEEGEKFQYMIGEYALAHQERLIQGTCIPKASSVYLAILDYLADIERHIRQMAYKITAQQL